MPTALAVIENRFSGFSTAARVPMLPATAHERRDAGGGVTRPHVLIAGAGIGGLVAALALHARGFPVDLYEQTPDLKEIGAGVQIAPNGTPRALRARPARRDGSDRERAGRQGGAAVQHRPELEAARYRRRGRGAMGCALLDGASRRLPPGPADARSANARPDACMSARAPPASCRMRMASRSRSAPATTARGEVLIGADGVHSRIREALFEAARATFHRLHGLARRGADRAPARAHAPPVRHQLDRPARSCRHLSAAARRTAQFRRRDRARRLARGKLVGGGHRRGMPRRFRPLASGCAGHRRADRRAVQMGAARA